MLGGGVGPKVSKSLQAVRAPSVFSVHSVSPLPLVLSSVSLSLKKQILCLLAPEPLPSSDKMAINNGH